MTSLLALLIAPAFACDHDGPCSHESVSVSVVVSDASDDIEPVDEDEAPEVDDEVDDDIWPDDCYEKACRRKPFDKGYVALRGDALALRERAAWGLSLRTMGKRDGWVVAEGRWTSDEAWMGRVGVGFDFLGRSNIDLGLGLVAGHIGDWQTATNQRFSIGTELLFAWRPGPFLIEHRHLGGPTPSGGIRTEGQTRLGFSPGEHLEVFLTWAAIDPGFDADHGFGGGVGLRF